MRKSLGAEVTLEALELDISRIVSIKRHEQKALQARYFDSKARSVRLAPLLNQALKPP